MMAMTMVILIMIMIMILMFDWVPELMDCNDIWKIRMRTTDMLVGQRPLHWMMGKPTQFCQRWLVAFQVLTTPIAPAVLRLCRSVLRRSFWWQRGGAQVKGTWLDQEQAIRT